MQIDTLVLGSYQTNSYILRAGEDRQQCLVIDTGLESEQLVEFLRQRRFLPEVVIFTHGHADHINGAQALRREFEQTKFAIHKLDAQMLVEPKQNLSALAGVEVVAPPADIIIEAEGPVEFAGVKLDVLHTPGHTPGGISLYSATDKCVFTGDALFAGSVGRTDFPGADGQRLIESVKSKLLVLPDETIVYPGHGPASNIAREKRVNPFLS